MKSLSIKFLILFLATLNLFSAQRKKKVDTIYIYEKVTVYDTIYLEKAIRLKHADIRFPSISTGNLILKKPETKKYKSKIKPEKTWTFGAEAGFGMKENIWSETISKKQWGENVGFWVAKKIKNTNLSFQLSGNLYHWNSTFDLDAHVEDTFLNGFYFTKNDEPLLFQKFNDKHFEAVVQLKAFYDWKKFRPSVGFLMNRNFYKMEFLVPENGVLSKNDTFISNRNNLGFSLGLQYRILKRISLSLDYQQIQMKNFSLKNSDFDFDIFKTNNTFVERKFNFGITYLISKP